MTFLRQGFRMLLFDRQTYRQTRPKLYTMLVKKSFPRLDIASWFVLSVLWPLSVIGCIDKKLTTPSRPTYTLNRICRQVPSLLAALLTLVPKPIVGVC